MHRCSTSSAPGPPPSLNLAATLRTANTATLESVKDRSCPLALDPCTQYQYDMCISRCPIHDAPGVKRLVRGYCRRALVFRFTHMHLSSIRVREIQALRQGLMSTLTAHHLVLYFCLKVFEVGISSIDRLHCVILILLFGILP